MVRERGGDEDRVIKNESGENWKEEDLFIGLENRVFIMFLCFRLWDLLVNKVVDRFFFLKSFCFKGRWIIRVINVLRK